MIGIIQMLTRQSQKIDSFVILDVPLLLAYPLPRLLQRTTIDLPKTMPKVLRKRKTTIFLSADEQDTLHLQLVLFFAKDWEQLDIAFICLLDPTAHRALVRSSCTKIRAVIRGRKKASSTSQSNRVARELQR